MRALGIVALLSAGLFGYACADDPSPGAPDASTPSDAGPDDNPDGGQGNPDATRNDGGFTWPVPTMPIAITAADDWKNTLAPDDPFVHGPDYDDMFRPNGARWVKFSVLMRDPTKVYFQDSIKYAFHYDFATARLNPLLGVTRAEFDRKALHELDQDVILGAVLFPPGGAAKELGIQLVRQDAYHPEMARIVLELARSAVITSTDTKAFYFPTFEQDASAQENVVFFAASGFPLSSPDRWGASHCYAPGWALGRLVYVPSAQIDAAYADGRLTAADVLLTDGVPAEVPFVAGIISTVAATPNSHVAILARSYQVPFGYVPDTAEQGRVRALDGHEVAVKVDETFGRCQVKIVDAQGKLDPQQRTELLALKSMGALTFPPKAHRGAYSASTNDITPADVQFFGGKAANFSRLRDAIPEASPDAIALSFDVWDDFMAQRLADGRTLSVNIAARLALHPAPLDIAAVKAELAAIRTIIEDQALVPPAVQTGILQAIARFPADKRIRFRSSTNVEDGAEFTGAGLYESNSGCVADDTDADTRGPSACDATKTDERGVFRAIQKVYASFYNDNAYLERARHGVDETKVGMALLVHPSFVDEDELANGVATIDVFQSSTHIKMVTQLGAISVTNPVGGARPEVVDIDEFSDMLYPSLSGRSTLVQLGGTVMTYPTEYESFARLFMRVGDQFATSTGRTEFTLDLEYKKVRGGALIVKQVREVARPDFNRMLPAFLLSDTTRRCTFQGERGDVWGNHRLKSRFTLPTRSTFLANADLATTFYGDVTHERLDDARVVTDTGAFTARPQFMRAFDENAITESWSVPGVNAGAAALGTSIARTSAVPRSPILTLADAQLTYEVEHAQPVIEVGFSGMPMTRTHDFTELTTCPEDNVIDGHTTLLERELNVGNKRIRVSYYWPPPPTGTTAGYTAPLHRWKETILEGFTGQPIVLRGYWSQTYRPGHHNFDEEFIFEPRLEQGLSQAVKDELEAAGVRLIHATYGDMTGTIGVLSPTGTYRRQ